MSYENKCKEILNLFHAASREVPQQDSDLGRGVQILQTICDSQSHIVPDADPEMYSDAHDMEGAFYDIFNVLEELENNIGDDDFTLDFDGNEYRIISNGAIWKIYRDEIQNIVQDCYSDVIKLDKMPAFIAVSIDWEQTAQNAYADGYGHTFSGYDGSEEEAAGYYIFRTN